VSADGTARVWTAANGAAVAILRHKGMNSAAFDDTATRVVTAGADGTARIWDASAGRPLATLRGRRDNVDSAAFDPEGIRVVTAGADGTARVWEAATGKAPSRTTRGRQLGRWCRLRRRRRAHSRSDGP
jgi:WD40 repeat protein